MLLPFQSGQIYTRKDIFGLLNLSPLPIGGNWFTGYHSHGGSHFVFANIGIAGRTGHRHANTWETPTRLRWFGKTGSSIHQPQIAAMLRGEEPVLIFHRTDNEGAFTFAGSGTPVDVVPSTPVEVLWQIAPLPFDAPLPEQILLPQGLPEGALRRVVVNAYERNAVARAACVDHFGTVCVACGFRFADVYGELGRGYIHVHHIKPLATVGPGYRVDPIQDLRPVCPNCHAMLHRQEPPITVEALQDILRRVRQTP